MKLCTKCGEVKSFANSVRINTGRTDIALGVSHAAASTILITLKKKASDRCSTGTTIGSAIAKHPRHITSLTKVNIEIGPENGMKPIRM
jgi:hypothetical protein